MQLFNINVGEEDYCQWLEGSRNQSCYKKGSSPLEALNSFSSMDPLNQPIDDIILYQQTTCPFAEFILADYGSDDEDEYVTEDSFKKRNIFKFWMMISCIKT